MAGYAVKAGTCKSYRRKSSVAITLVAVLSCVGVGLLIYSLVNASYLFAISYFIAVILGFTYVFIKYNTVYTTYLATDRQSIYIKNWENGFFPYDALNKIRIISEFVPAKTYLTEIPIDDIAVIMIGTKNFIMRHGQPKEDFILKLDEIESNLSASKIKKISAMDLVYVETHEGKCGFMPVTEFSKRDVTKIIQLVMRKNPEVEVKVNSRSYRIFMAKNK